MSTLLSIDTGVQATGYAYWVNSKLVDSGVWRASADAAWSKKCDEIMHRFSTYLERIPSLTRLAMEWPELWCGVVSWASGVKGALFELSYLCGRMAERVQGMHTEISLIPAREWKGQLPKDVVKRRLFHRFGRKFREHEADAIGLGLYVLTGRRL